MEIITVSEMLRRSRGMNVKLEMLIAVGELTDEAVILQREQLADGLRNDDEHIYKIKTGDPYYSDAYARIKGYDSPIDLHAEGDFYNEIEATEGSDGLFIESKNWKNEMLQKTYGKAIFGFGTNASTKFNPLAHERLIRNIKLNLAQKK